MDEKELYAQLSDADRAVIDDELGCAILTQRVLTTLRQAIRERYPACSDAAELATARLVVMRLYHAMATAIASVKIEGTPDAERH